MRKVLTILTAWLLAGCGGQSTAGWIEQLRSKDAAERLHAIKALEKKSEAAAIVPALTSVLGDEDAFVRRDAARALGRFGPESRSALPALLPLLRDQNAGVRKAAVAALAAIDPEAGSRAKIR
jgi:HEAT repeat protein